MILDLGFLRIIADTFPTGRHELRTGVEVTFCPRRDLTGEGEIELARLRFSVARIQQRGRAGRDHRTFWQVRARSDFHRIERRLAARWIIGHIVARTINRPKPWTHGDYLAAERRMHLLAWSADQSAYAIPAMARVRAIRAACLAAGFRPMDENAPLNVSQGFARAALMGL